jgi:hypothetical protein
MSNLINNVILRLFQLAYPDIPEIDQIIAQIRPLFQGVADLRVAQRTARLHAVESFRKDGFETAARLMLNPPSILAARDHVNAYYEELSAEIHKSIRSGAQLGPGVDVASTGLSADMSGSVLFGAMKEVFHSIVVCTEPQLTSWMNFLANCRGWSKFAPLGARARLLGSSQRRRM